MRGSFVDGEGLFDRNLTKLQKEQASWRRKHDALKRRKEAEHQKTPSCFHAPAINFSCRRPSTSPWSEARPRTAADPSVPSTHPGLPVTASRRTSAALSPRPRAPLSSPRDNASAGSRQNPDHGRTSMLPNLNTAAPSQSSRRSSMSKGADTFDARGADRATVICQKVGEPVDTPKAPSVPSGFQLLMKAKDPGRRKSNNEEDVTDVVAIAQRNAYPLDEAWKLWDEFRSLDTKGTGYLSLQEFEQLVRNKCNLPSGEAIPEHLFEEQCRKLGIQNSIKFEAYLLWATATAFSEEIMVPDPAIRCLRKLAREYAIPFDAVEEVKAIFDKYDVDGSGGIELCEFRQVLSEMVPAKPSEINLRRFFKEVDANGDGVVDFNEFLAWFVNVMGR